MSWISTLLTLFSAKIDNLPSMYLNKMVFLRGRSSVSNQGDIFVYPQITLETCLIRFISHLCKGPNPGCTTSIYNTEYICPSMNTIECPLGRVCLLIRVRTHCSVESILSYLRYTWLINAMRRIKNNTSLSSAGGCITLMLSFFSHTRAP